MLRELVAHGVIGVHALGDPAAAVKKQQGIRTVVLLRRVDAGQNLPPVHIHFMVPQPVHGLKRRFDPLFDRALQPVGLFYVQIRVRQRPEHHTRKIVDGHNSPVPIVVPARGGPFIF